MNMQRAGGIAGIIHAITFVAGPVGAGAPIPPQIAATIHERAAGKLGGPTPPEIEPAPGSAKPKR